MSEERAPYYTTNQGQPKPAHTPQTWQLITFRDGSILEIMSRAVHEDALAVEWAKEAERWLNEQVNPSDLLAE